LHYLFKNAYFQIDHQTATLLLLNEKDRHMKQTIASICLAGMVVSLTGCGFPYLTLSSYSFGRTDALNAQCTEKNITIAERLTADSLFALGETLYKEGKHKEALDLVNGAGIYYRMVLVKDELRQTEEQIETVRTKLNEAEQRLATYQKVLEQLKEGGGEK
jgi:hypothetical protein